MDEKMEEKKQEEVTEQQAELEAATKAITDDIKRMTEDRCPHCLQPISAMPYVNFHPVMGWVECAACGVVFSPKSIRDMKLEQSQKRIKIPPKKLAVPSKRII